MIILMNINNFFGRKDKKTYDIIEHRVLMHYLWFST